MNQERIDELNKERLKEISESPAYPVSMNGCVYSGMTLREYFASQAMIALINNKTVYSDKIIANMAVNQADALIKELNSNK